jgi:carboxypeptidase C (cathepsin A)
MGYYDVACTMGSNDDLLDRLSLDPRLKDSIVRTRYSSGHMMYLDDVCRKQLRDDIVKFIKSQNDPKAPRGSFKKN